MSTQTDDPTKWSDRGKEIALGAAFGAAFFAVGTSGATAVGAVVIGGSLVVCGTLVVGCPEKERPAAMYLGVVFGVAVTAGLSDVVGGYVSDRFEEEKKITAPASAHANPDVVAKFAEDMNSKGLQVTLG